MWTSLIQYADYVWLACRTDPDAPRHHGLSILIGADQRPGLLLDAGAHHGRPITSATYYSDVRVPASALVGAENQGWGLITNQLNHERVALSSAAWNPTAARGPGLGGRTNQPTGQRVIDPEWCRSTWPGRMPGGVPEPPQLVDRGGPGTP